ncbi:hypothetical protein [Ehrlichia muris]|uniref:Uncharacterized protein n=2 Tax=Ehrlichia muris TaxID=35795 RepID=V9R8S4_9RICK|nr:hypothetical protein [Ehrlichia muris]AHC39698.1 hypothetical protein EMUR_01820 [Ehrlichia muris AS145]AHC39699.1 hypothetical protein EMUR_01825 [Ehrlichia muris AS145]
MYYYSNILGISYVFVFPQFKRHFDFMLDKLIYFNVFAKSQIVEIHGIVEVVLMPDRVEDLLEQDTFTLGILAAQLIVRNQTLYGSLS